MTVEPALVKIQSSSNVLFVALIISDLVLKLKCEKRGRHDWRGLWATHGSAPGSDLRHASIDGEIHTGDVRTFIGGEERDCCRDFLGHASAAHWDLRGELCDCLLGLFSGEARRRRQGRGVDRSGTHRIHADLAVFQFHSPAAREVAYSRLTRGVSSKSRKPEHV